MDGRSLLCLGVKASKTKKEFYYEDKFYNEWMAEWICRNIYQISQKVSAIYTEISFFIASDFSNRASTQYYLQQNLKQFKEHDILFQEANIIDDEITPAESVQLITEADVILLAGGPTLRQISSIRKYGLAPVLQRREGITIGISAGAINMAKQVVLAKDISDDIPELSIYEGIGLTDVNIEPHLGDASTEHLEEIRQAAYYAPIYGLYDESFILEVDRHQYFLAHVNYLHKSKKKSLLCLRKEGFSFYRTFFFS